MKTVSEISQKVRGLFVAGITVMLLTGGCSTVKENGDPEVDLSNTTVITTDEQRKLIYERGGRVSPQHANPIPTADELGLDEKASEINRKTNIEQGGNQNDPATLPTEERPRQVPNAGNDTIGR